jgi:hypothetical protein
MTSRCGRNRASPDTAKAGLVEKNASEPLIPTVLSHDLAYSWTASAALSSTMAMTIDLRSQLSLRKPLLM